MPVQRPQVILRLGSHSEKEYFEKTVRFLNGMIVGANLVEATPGATASLFVRLCRENARAAYFIDPMTYAFGTYCEPIGTLREDLRWIKSEQKIKGTTETELDFKRTYRKLAEELGDPFDLALSRGRALKPSDFASSSINATCQRVAEYQRRRVKRELEKDAEFKDYAEDVPEPSAVFAPYFYAEPGSWKSWMNTNLTLAQTTAELCVGVEVHAIICADESFLGDGEFVKLLQERLPETGVDGVWLWFSKFEEHRAPTATLGAFRDLARNLSESMKVYNLHGGYFSLALSKFGMSGISHGVGYGEQKDVVPVIGVATPTVRYYLPDVHRRLGVPQIERALPLLKITSPAEFHQQVDDCAVCSGVVKDSLQQFSAYGDMHYASEKSQRKSQTPAAAKRCRFHFMLSRIRERDEISRQTLDEIRAGLRISMDKWGTIPVVKRMCTHLPRWEAALFDYD